MSRHAEIEHVDSDLLPELSFIGQAHWISSLWRLLGHTIVALQVFGQLGHPRWSSVFTQTLSEHSVGWMACVAVDFVEKNALNIDAKRRKCS